MGFSGVNCAGLIETPRNPGSRGTHRAKFSGVNCAGLIETVMIVCSLIECDSFSGVNCAGLIETAALIREDETAQGCFPALIAPASLKLIDGQHRLGRRVGFPALIAPASLKPRQTR